MTTSENPRARLDEALEEIRQATVPPRIPLRDFMEEATDE